MAKILVLYCSTSGNTEKMALLVYKGAESIPGNTVRLKSVQEADTRDLEWCDGIAVGFSTTFGSMPWEMKKWWDNKLDSWMKVDGKFGCTFSSSGAWGGGAEIACQSMLMVLINFGFLVFGVTDYTGPKFAPHYGSVLAGEPVEDHERDSCIRLGMRLSEWCAVYMDGDKSRHPLVQNYVRNPPTPRAILPILNYEKEILQAKKQTSIAS